MSAYTVAEIVVWLLLAATLGFVLGWLSRLLYVRRQDSHVSGRSVTTAPPRATPAPAVVPGRFPGSARPLPAGAAPSPAYVIKGNEKSMIYHTRSSPSYARTVAQTWFATENAAVAAGFRKPRNG